MLLLSNNPEPNSKSFCRISIVIGRTDFTTMSYTFTKKVLMYFNHHTVGIKPIVWNTKEKEDNLTMVMRLAWKAMRS